MTVKRIVLLGASGSIGTQTIQVCQQHPDQFEITAISVKSKVTPILSLLENKKKLLVCVEEKELALKLQEKYPWHHLVYGEDGLIQCAQYSNSDLVVNALVGFVGCKPTLAAIEAKKDIALANKETLVAAGSLVMAAAKQNQVQIIPIDSEHSAIFQCLQGQKSNISRIVLTASGGSFRDYTRAQLSNVTIKDALAHPNWSMGAKITIDSATMMNKGFELIEAFWLFGVDYDQIEVLIHRQSLIHSMVEFPDTAWLAQLGTPNMQVPIQYALSFPNRLKNESKPLDLNQLKELTFEKVDYLRFPLLKKAYEVGKQNNSAAAALNGANEVAVEAFLQGKIRFIDIDEWVIEAVDAIEHRPITKLEDVIWADQAGRFQITKRIKEN